MATCNPDFHSSDFNYLDFQVNLTEFNYQNFIVNQLPEYFRRNDSYKDKNGDGLLTRYLSVFGDEIDQEIIPSIECYINNIDASIAEGKFLTHISDVLGNPPDIFGNENIYRNLLSYICSVYKIKGTKLAYELFFSLLGFTIDLIEIEPNKAIYHYDDGGIYDDGLIYDSGQCEPCSYYDIIFYPKDYNNYVFTNDLILKLRAAIKFNEPINAKLRYLTLGIRINDSLNINMIDGNTTNIQDIASIYDVGNEYDTENMEYDDTSIINPPTLLQTKATFKLEKISNYWRISSNIIKNFEGDIDTAQTRLTLSAKYNNNVVYESTGTLINNYVQAWVLKSTVISNSHYIPNNDSVRLQGVIKLENGMKANINLLLNLGDNVTNLHFS